MLVKMGRLDEGVQALRLAVEREPFNAGYQLGLGRALADANQDPVDVIAHIREAVRLAPDVPGIEAHLYAQVTAICDWDAAERVETDLVARAQREPANVWTRRVFPFDTLLMRDCPGA